MKFWRLEHPDYDSDYKYSYTNGELDHPFGLPGVKCDICHATGGFGRVLPFECPVSLRGRKHIKERWPISLDLHKALQEEVRAELRKEGIEAVRLRPGDSFQPCYLDIPSRPRADFLWSFGTVIISERVKQVCESLRIQGAAYSPVTLRKVGKREAHLRAPIPPSGEPEDILNEVPLLTHTDSMGPYFEMTIESESGYAPGGEPLSICAGCGRERFPETDARFLLVESMWKGDDIFFLAGTYHMVVTDRFREVIQNLKATNVHFQPLDHA